jgi:hypothetical protein
MLAVRKIVPANVLATLIDLPWKSKDQQVEIIVMPVGEKTSDNSPAKSLKGSLKEYANPALVKKERKAWQDNVAEKYGAL